MFKKSHAGFAALVTAAVLVLTGCGNSSADNTNPPVTEETPAAAEPRLSSMRVLHEKTLAADLYEVLVVEDIFKDADGEIVERVEYPEGEQRRMTIGFAEVEAPRAGECGYEQSLEFIEPGSALQGQYSGITDLHNWINGGGIDGRVWDAMGVALPEDDQKLIGPDGETLVLTPQSTGGSLIVSALLAEGYALPGDALGEHNTSADSAQEQNLGLWAEGCFE